MLQEARTSDTLSVSSLLDCAFGLIDIPQVLVNLVHSHKRRTILEIVPEAEQEISYRVPAFRIQGKVVAGSPHSGIT